nr:glucosaminidase domain-containing protein [Clostridium aestuarii]
MLLSIISTTAFAESSITMPSKSEVNVNKPWTVKFNMDLEKNTVNSDNITVVDSRERELKVTIVPGKDSKSIVIYPPTGGYIPGDTYYLNLSTNVKGKSGSKLSKSVRMKFTTAIQYEDCTNYPSLPSIKNVEILEKPVLKNEKVNFKILADYSSKVQYRVYAFKYPNDMYDNSNVYPNEEYVELTDGYTSSLSTYNPFNLSVDKGFESGKYKFMIYVKRSNLHGKHKDGNTDFDNYYTSYFKVLENDVTENANTVAVIQPKAGVSEAGPDEDSQAETDDVVSNQNIGINDTIIYNKYDKTIDEFAKQQFTNGKPMYSETARWARGSESLIKYYLDAANFLDDEGKYQFLNLNYMEGVKVEELNEILKDKGVLEGKGEVFLKAAKESDVNPIYLISHALLETGNGKSKLATGVLVETVDGKKVEPKKTYNVFGIRAYDDDPLKGGSEYAYKEEWFSVDEAIIGGAKFITNGYINSDKYKQNTLYKMRWNIQVMWHQYSTDIAWAKKQVKNIKKLMEQCKSAKPVYEIPQYMKSTQ